MKIQQTTFKFQFDVLSKLQAIDGHFEIQKWIALYRVCYLTPLYKIRSELYDCIFKRSED